MSNIGSLLSKFTALLDQQGRMMKVETALPLLALVPERMVMRESCGQPFEMVLDCLSTSVEFDPQVLKGQEISLRLLQADGRYKPWHALVQDAMMLGSDGGSVHFRVIAVPWLLELSARSDQFIYQDLTAQAIIEAVFADYDMAQFRFEVTQRQRVRSICTQCHETDLAFVQRLIAEEGWSYHFEHLDGDAAQGAQDAGHAKHIMVIHDRLAPRTDLGTVRFTSQHATARTADQRDAVTAFMAQRTLLSNAITLGSWDYKALAGTTAQDTLNLTLGDVPRLEVYDGSGAYRYQDADLANQAASVALAALALDTKRFEGQGSARHFHPGFMFSLVDHPIYTGQVLPGAVPLGQRQRTDNQFTLLAVEHHATNNLGADMARLLANTELERGTYKNHFHCAPAASPIVHRHLRKPTAPAAEPALVVGMAQEPLTTDRDQRVKVQWPWQRGLAPNRGGLPHDEAAADTQGNAPGNERSGTWVRVAQASAGANWGSVFTPRIGMEVQIAYLEDDIDRPVVTGQTHNEQDAPPFAAGVDSGINHAGVISGLHTHRLDATQGGGDFNQWAIDDTSGQLRMRMHCSYTTAELGLGHLIQQSASSAQRGAWRGKGFEASTQGWGDVRSGKGMLLSTTPREGRYGSAQSTQMDAAEAVAQLKAACQLGQNMGTVARQARAHPPSTHDAGQALAQFIDLIDPSKQGKHPATVQGQQALKAQSASRELAAPVEAFAQPVVLLDTPSTASMTTEASMASYAGQDLSVVAQGDWHQSAAHTHALVSGQTTSLHAHTGGLKAYAANGPISARAHTDELHMLADKEVTVVSVNDEIRVQAATRIEMVGGQSSLVLDGGDITFTCPGQWRTKGSQQAFLGGGGSGASMAALPQGLSKLEPATAQISHDYHDSEALAGAPFEALINGKEVRRGILDAQGVATMANVQPGAAIDIRFGQAPGAFKPKDLRAMPEHKATPQASDIDALLNKYSGGQA